MLVLLYGVSGRAALADSETDFRPLARRTGAMAIGVWALSSVLFWGIIRVVWGNTFAGHASLHIRFGPNATAKGDPKKGQKHP